MCEKKLTKKVFTENKIKIKLNLGEAAKLGKELSNKLLAGNKMVTESISGSEERIKAEMDRRGLKPEDGTIACDGFKFYFFYSNKKKVE